jgi:hypothetical protein
MKKIRKQKGKLEKKSEIVLNLNPSNSIWKTKIIAA